MLQVQWQNSALVYIEKRKRAMRFQSRKIIYRHWRELQEIQYKWDNIIATRRSMRIFTILTKGKNKKGMIGTIKQRMGIEETIIQDIEKKQFTWYGHVVRVPKTRWSKRRLKLKWQKPYRFLQSERYLSTEHCEDRRDGN